MKRILMVALIGLVLSGCDAATKERTAHYVMPKDLAEKGCKVYNMQSDGAGETLNVVFCPGAQVATEYRVGKSNATVVAIDEGVDYGY